MNNDLRSRLNSLDLFIATIYIGNVAVICYMFISSGMLWTHALLLAIGWSFTVAIFITGLIIRSGLL